jgi:hypothetical protein
MQAGEAGSADFARCFWKIMLSLPVAIEDRAERIPTGWNSI